MTVRQNLMVNFLVIAATLLLLLLALQQKEEQQIAVSLKNTEEAADKKIDSVTVAAAENVDPVPEICDFNKRELFFKVRDLEKARQEQEAKRIREAEELKKKQEQEALRKKQEEEKKKQEAEKARLEKEKQEKARLEKERLEKEKQEQEKNRIVPLSAYPDTWPRLKLTGIYLMPDGRKRVIITGGKTLVISTGDLDSCHYYEGDEVGSGVFLHEIKENNVVLIKDKQSWSIRLGAEPPAVKKK